MERKLAKKMNISNEHTEKSVNDLFLEGINITRSTSLVSNCMDLARLRKSYYLWVCDIRDFCSRNELSPQRKSFFYEEDKVFLTLNRGCGVDLNSDFSQTLLKNIFQETKKKLVYLRKIKIDETIKMPKTFRIQLKDREIWVNQYILSKPHAVGKNMSFFEYFMNHPNKEIKRIELPEGLQKEITGMRIVKILNSIGFKGEVLKVFFPKRSKTLIKFTPLVKEAEVRKRVKINVFIKELDLANTKNRE